MKGGDQWRWPRALAAASMLLMAACGDGAPGPAVLDTRNDACRACRMTVSNQRFAAQLVAPGEEPAFFDDIGCLVGYLAANVVQPPGAAAYVADHRTRAWVPAALAVYARVPRLETPMSSHVIAHANLASQRADPDAAGAEPLSVSGLFGAHPPPGVGPAR